MRRGSIAAATMAAAAGGEEEEEEGPKTLLLALFMPPVEDDAAVADDDGAAVVVVAAVAASLELALRRWVAVLSVMINLIIVRDKKNMGLDRMACLRCGDHAGSWSVTVCD
jgi:hypothetical protein